ncbi:hypothetical protein DSCO28_00800 [Desulfosarcina ovata subsp. sediminis]|uniref:Methyltransferase type 12 domain-containing protein n=1 Tax=Desulfosarcina ovata subsp. sediminis TaxID=885957 RepID=A0A5K7ZE28_9BACT|nr:methyltransferase domain-containing protein [Desulfosarcina ovata]BBO79514.1 hypothetical protein DSCO28_00800 [Desulfosarcina ovata subsp. sediminis]
MSSKPYRQYFGRDLEAMGSAENYHHWIINEFKPYIRGHVAEVGAGSGNISTLLREYAERLTVFEPSDNMYPLLFRRFLHDSKVCTIHNTLSVQRQQLTCALDTVIYVNVLEHIENDEKELAHIHEVLKPGGHALIFVPALPFLFSNFDRQVGHFRRYLKKNLICLSEKIGFKPVKARYFDFAGIIPWFLLFVLLKQTLTGKNVNYYDKYIIPINRIFEKIISPPIGKNILLIIQKR